MKILVPNTIELDLGTSGEEVASYQVDQPIPDEHIDAEVLVTWQNTSGNLEDAARRLKNLQLVQTLAAGPDSVLATGDLPGVLATTDVLISILPATPETENSLNEEILNALPDTAVFVNVGRGATVDEDALLAALRDGRLRAAAVDVTKTEPLPAGSELWSAPNLIITPHVAGNRPKGGSALVLSNIAALRERRELKNLVR